MHQDENIRESQDLSKCFYLKTLHSGPNLLFFCGASFWTIVGDAKINKLSGFYSKSNWEGLKSLNSIYQFYTKEKVIWRVLDINLCSLLSNQMLFKLSSIYVWR